MTRVVLMLAALMFTAGIAATVKEKAPDATQVHVEGCVEQGVEAGCLVVKDLKEGKLYNILVKGRRPGVGGGIEFTGVPHDGPTSCMQGIALDVSKWAPKLSLKCSQGGTLEKQE